MLRTIITITCLSKNVAGPYKYTVKRDMGAPLTSATPPELEKFTTREDADARAKEIQEEAGGPDNAEIRVLDLSPR